MAEQNDPEALKRIRGVSHMKFKRKVKCLQLLIDKEGTPENLHRGYDELNKAYEQLEQAHDLYLEQIFLTSDLESEETFMDDVDSLKMSVTTAYDKALNRFSQDKEVDLKKSKLLPEDSQCSSEEIPNKVGKNEKQSVSIDFHQVREDLKIMFPCLDAEDIEAALRDEHGDVNKTIDRLLTTATERNTQENGSQRNISMNHLPECNICYEVYNEDDHRPLVLPCGHTLCKACIINVTTEGWNTVTVHCPTCRKYHTINSDQLITNYSVLDLLQASGNSAQNNERSMASSQESTGKYSKFEKFSEVEIKQVKKINSPTKPDGNSSTKSKDKSNARNGILKKVGIGLGCVAGGAAAVVAAPVVLTGVGFTSAGIAAGSWAASMMSAAAVANGGAIAAGSTVAILQSAGAVGLGAGLTAGVAAGGAAVGGGVAAGVTKLAGRNTNDTDNKKEE